MTSRRPPSTPSVPAAKPSCKIHSTAIIADKAVLTGTHLIEIGENTIIHPYARIRSDGGAVKIGKNCIVYERAVIGCAEGAEQDVVVGDEVNVDTGAVVESKSVGEGSEG